MYFIFIRDNFKYTKINDYYFHNTDNKQLLRDLPQLKSYVIKIQ